MEIRVGFEPTINSFAGCPLQPLEYRIMAGIVGFKPTVAGIKGRCLSRLAISQYLSRGRTDKHYKNRTFRPSDSPRLPG